MPSIILPPVKQYILRCTGAGPLILNLADVGQSGKIIWPRIGEESVGEYFGAPPALHIHLASASALSNVIIVRKHPIVNMIWTSASRPSALLCYISLLYVRYALIKRYRIF